MNGKGMLAGALLVAAVLGGTSPVLGQTTVVYVDDTAPGATHNGNSWFTAFLNLEEGLDAAEECVGACELRVAQGTYVPSEPQGDRFDSQDPRAVSFRMLNGVDIMGGYRGCVQGICTNADQRDIQEYESILSGQGARVPHSSRSEGWGTDGSAKGFRVVNPSPTLS